MNVLDLALRHDSIQFIIAVGFDLLQEVIHLQSLSVARHLTVNG